MTFTFTPSGKHHRAAGTLTFHGRKGANKCSFLGKLGGRHKLKRGKYTVAIVASASGVKSKPQTLKFTIVK